MCDYFFKTDRWIQALIYGFVGLNAEIFFTSLSDWIAPQFLCSWNVHGKGPITAKKPDWRMNHDSKLVGYTFLWMFPAYALFLVLLGEIHNVLWEQFWILRGFIYLAIFWAGEFLFGALLKKMTGYCPWDYSYSRFSIKGYIRLDYAPVWFGSGLLFEYLHDGLVRLTPTIQTLFF